jgi:ubiquilin
MIGMMQNPQFASTLNEALQNPQLIDMMIQQNPMLRGMGPQVRQMMQTPEFRRIMTDPEQLRQMARIQRMYPGMMPPGMAGGSNAFPAPGVTDTTPVQDRDSSQQQQPNNPFAALLGGPSAQAGGQAANPFAALFPPTTAHTPTTSPPAASAGQGASASPDTPSATAAAPPFQTAFPFGSPQMMQQMAQMMQSMNPPAGAPDDSQAGAENPFAALLASMNAGGAGAAFPGGWPPAPFGPFGGAPNVPQDTRPPEERYAEQLRQLNDMGFHEFERNVEALRRTGGSVTGAVEYLLTH